MILDIELSGKYKLAKDLACKETDDEIYIVLANSGMGSIEDALFTVTGTGRLIWQLLNGTNSVRQIIEQVLQHYDAPQDVVLQDVVMFLEELAVRGMITE